MPIIIYFFLSVLLTLWYFVKIHLAAHLWSMRLCIYTMLLKVSKIAQWSSHFLHKQQIQGFRCLHLHTPPRLTVSLAPADPPGHGGIPCNIYVLWLRWLSTRDVFVKSLGGGGWWLVAVDDCSLPGCVGSHIQSIWEILEGRWDDEKEM